MRVLLVHNPSAGSGDHHVDALSEEIQRAGHHLVCRVADADEAMAHLDACELVVVAGGDGTVNAAAHVLRGTDVPFTVLPLGTANNVARALGIEGEPSALVQGWIDHAVTPFDVGVVWSAPHTKAFMEGFGFGVFPRVIHETEDDDGPETREERLARDLAVLEARIADAPLEHYVLEVDGDDASDDYLMVEILNIPFLGPGFTLAPQASPHDGLLDVVLVGAEERALLLQVVRDVRAGLPPSVELPVRRARHVRVRGDGRPHHRDGERFDVFAGPFEVHVEADALRVHAPPPKDDAVDPGEDAARRARVPIPPLQATDRG